MAAYEHATWRTRMCVHICVSVCVCACAHMCACVSVNGEIKHSIQDLS